MNNSQPLNKIEESFMNVINGIGGISDTPFIKSLGDPDVIKKGDSKEIGQSLQRISNFLNARLQDLEFQPYEKDKTKLRLEKGIISLNEMGKELESINDEELNDYHWYIVGMLVIILFSLFDHVQIYQEERD